MTIKETKRAVDLILKVPQVITPYIHGMPGIGKSEIMAQLAEKRDIAFLDFRLSTIESSDVRGIPTPDLTRGSSRWLPPETIPFEAFADLYVPGDPKKRKFKDGGILFLDEFNRARFDVLQAAFQMVLDRRVGLHKILDNWFLACAGNLGEADKTEVTEITDSALNNRFIHFFIDERGIFDCWVEWAEGEGKVNHDVIGYLRSTPSAIYTEVKENDVIFCTPRSWTKFGRLLDQNVDMNPIEVTNLLGPHIIGAASVSFISFLKERSKIKPEDVLFKYEKFAAQIKKLPRDRIYSISTEIVAYIKDKSKTKFITKELLTNFHKFTTEDLDKDHMIAIYKALSDVNVIVEGKGKEKEKTVEFMDPYLDNFPDMNDLIADILYKSRDNANKK